MNLWAIRSYTFFDNFMDISNLPVEPLFQNPTIKYVMRFKHPVNSMEIFGYISSVIKERWVIQGLYEKCVQLGRDSQSNKISDIILFELKQRSHYSADELIDVLKMLSIERTQYDELFKNLHRPDHEYVVEFIKRLNSMKFPLLEKAADVINANIYQHMNEDIAKEAMSPAAVAALLNNTDDTDDDDMLNRLEAFAAEVDQKLSPVINCEWIIN